jgi:glucan phosphoethanolaminetransferase (alkaline phosphatase superfamily)
LEAYDFMNLNRMAILSLVLLVLTALSLIWYVNYDPEKEKGLPGLVLSILLLLLLTSIAFMSFKAYRRAHNMQAVLLENSAELREEADSGSARVAKIHEGVIVDIQKSSGEWMLVRLPNGQSGWIEDKLIARVMD